MKCVVSLICLAICVACLAVAPILVGLLASSGCSGTQRPWTTDVDAKLSVSAHALDAADAVVAQRYTAEVALPGANLDAIDARYSTWRSVRALERQRLIAAEAALAGGGCPAAIALRLAQAGMVNAGDALGLLGIQAAPVIGAALAGLAGVVESAPLCPGVP